MKKVNSIALFRLQVIGPLTSVESLDRGQLQEGIRAIAQRHHAIPNSNRTLLSVKTIQCWYYAWRKGGFDALVPKSRNDRGHSKISAAVQEAILEAKRENPRRSINQIERLLVVAGVVPAKSLSRSSVHRLLQQNGLSRIAGSSSLSEERRSFEAEFAGTIWYGDAMHGPKVVYKGKLCKTYLVSLIDDASRLVAHSAFCVGETALDIEGVLKQALLRRGLPRRIIVDNGPAYRAATLQGICARLGIHLIFCKPYTPQGKGKLERWHRTVRDSFLSEVDERHITDLADLNARLWAWLEQIYHQTPHAGLGNGLTPLARYQRDLPRIQTLGTKAAQLDDLFMHRVKRHVRKDGTVSYSGQRFEVPCELSGKTVHLVVDPHAQRVVGVEDDAGVSLGQATPLNLLANIRRTRRQSQPVAEIASKLGGPNLVELAHAKYHGIGTPKHKKEK
jgi:transposase InsO family protein